MGTPYQITLKSIKVIENGTIEEEDGINGLVATLYYPDLGKTAVVSTREFSLRDKEAHSFTEIPYPNQILFKENILHDAFIEIELTSISKSTLLHKLFHKVAFSLMKQAANSIPLPPALSGIIKNTTESLFDILKPTDKVVIIGKGGWLISEDYGDNDLPLNLEVPRQIVLKQKIHDDDGTKYVSETVPKGYTNAHVVLGIKKLQ